MLAIAPDAVDPCEGRGDQNRAEGRAEIFAYRPVRATASRSEAAELVGTPNAFFANYFTLKTETVSLNRLGAYPDLPLIAIS